MLRKGILLIIDIFVVVMDGIAVTVILLKNYAIQVWGNNMIRKWVYKCLNFTDAVVYRIKKYLEEVRIVLKYRIYYENVTRPMKYYYRELKKK